MTRLRVVLQKEHAQAGHRSAWEEGTTTTNVVGKAKLCSKSPQVYAREITMLPLGLSLGQLVLREWYSLTSLNGRG